MKYLAVLSALAMAACAPAYPTLEVETSPHEAVTRYSFNRIRSYDDEAGRMSDFAYRMRGVEQDGTLRHQLVITGYFRDWAYLESIAKDGDYLTVIALDDDVFCTASGCNFEETIGLEMSADEIAGIADSGQAFEGIMIGRDRSLDFSIPATYFADYLGQMQVAQR
jgi:hypothetical protein